MVRHVAGWLRDEEVNASGSLIEASCHLSVNSVQQEVQQHGRATTRIHDYGHRWLAAQVLKSSLVPVVRIEVV